MFVKIVKWNGKGKQKEKIEMGNSWKYKCIKCNLEQPYGTGKCKRGCAGFLKAFR